MFTVEWEWQGKGNACNGGLWSSRLKIILVEVLSPKIFSSVTRNAELCQLNFYHAQQHPNIFLALVLSQWILKNDIKCIHSLLTLYDFMVQVALPKLCQVFQVIAAWTSRLVNCILSSHTGFFNCKHLFIDKPMVITESSVPSAQLLGLGSKLHSSNIQHMLNKGLTLSKFLFLGMIMYANEVETKEQIKITWDETTYWYIIYFSF